MQVDVANVSKVHVSTKGEPLLALLDVNFQVEKNEFFSIVGPSGCGKTTLLNLLAGFEQPTRGELKVGGEAITSPGWERAVVFQEYALFPWYTVVQNIRYGLRRKRVPEPEQRRLVDRQRADVGAAESARRLRVGPRPAFAKIGQFVARPRRRDRCRFVSCARRLYGQGTPDLDRPLQTPRVLQLGLVRRQATEREPAWNSNSGQRTQSQATAKTRPR